MNKSIKKSKKKNHIFSMILVLLLLILCALFVYQLYELEILSMPYFVMISAIVILIGLIFLILHIKRYKHEFSHFLVSFLVFLLVIGLSMGNIVLYKAPRILNQLSSLSDVLSEQVAIVTMKKNKNSDLKKMNGCQVGVIEKIDLEGTETMKSDLKNKHISFETVEYNSVHEMVKALYGGKVDYIILNQSYLDLIEDSKDLKNYSQKTKNIYEINFESKLSVENLSEEELKKMVPSSFTVLISGNDAYGKLGKDTMKASMRSDSNILMTVNPHSGTILMTSIPRDYYLEIAESGYEGQYDKLTHTGLLGLHTTERTIEKALDIDIDYVVRVNFSSMIKLVNALDGIDIEVSKDIAEQSKNYVIKNKTDLSNIKPGINHLNGKQALDFSRERYAYEDGDVQRVKNQQTVMKAIIKKASSASSVLRYGKLLDAVGDLFRTNMPAKLMSNLIRYEVTAKPDWKFEKYVLNGDFGNEFCCQLGSNASVVLPSEYSMEIAHDKIQAVLEGKSSNIIKDEEAKVKKLEKEKKEKELKKEKRDAEREEAANVNETY